MTDNPPNRRAWRAGLLLAGAGLCLASGLAAQEPQGSAKAPKAYEPPPLFSDITPVEFTLYAPYRQVRKERTGVATYRPGQVRYAADTGVVTLPVRVRTRGIFRRRNCEMPPLLLNFTKDSTRKSTFAKLDRVRLSPHCRDTDDQEQYVLQEYQLYRVQRLLTPLSFEVRLARVTYVDSEKKDTLARRWAFLQEQDEPFAERAGMKLTTITGATPADLDAYESAFTGVWQYFIGNTDFSISALHNIVLLEKPGFTYVPVARDFDWSGAVNARYAGPSPIIVKQGIRTVKQRIMRGYCTDPAEYEKVFSLFREKKDAIYALYADSVGALMEPKVVKATLEYFDEFYETINDPALARRRIVEACLNGSA